MTSVFDCDVSGAFGTKTEFRDDERLKDAYTLLRSNSHRTKKQIYMQIL